MAVHVEPGAVHRDADPLPGGGRVPRWAVTSVSMRRSGPPDLPRDV